MNADGVFIGRFAFICVHLRNRPALSVSKGG
jgi:hypothetical protein